MSGEWGCNNNDFNSHKQRLRHPRSDDCRGVFETLLELDRLLHDLPALVKRVFLRAQVDGLGQRAIARELGISLATVKR